MTNKETELNTPYNPRTVLRYAVNARSSKKTFTHGWPDFLASLIPQPVQIA